MKECLDTIRHVQTAALIVAAALLALAATPNEAARFDAALEQLRELPQADLSATAEARLRNQAAYKELFLKVNAAAHGEGTGPPCVDAPPRKPSRFSAIPVGAAFPKDSSFFEDGFAAAPANDTVDAHVRFYKGIRQRLFALPEPELVRKTLRESPGRAKSCAFSGYTTDYWQVSLWWDVASDRTTTGTEPLLLDDFLKTVPHRAAPDYATSEQLNAELLHSVFPDLWVEGFVAWYSSGEERVKQTRRLERLASLDERMQPTVWDEVHALPRLEAIRHVEEQAREATQSLSLAGLQIDERLATFGGPLALWVILLYLLVHLLHLRRLAAGGASIPADYPWPPLFPGWLGAISSAMLLAILPVAAAVRFARRVYEGTQFGGDDPRRLFYVGALAVAVAATGFGAHVITRRLPRAAEERSAWQRELLERWRGWKPFRLGTGALELSARSAVRIALVECAIAFAVTVGLTVTAPLVFGTPFETWADRTGTNLLNAARMFAGFAGLFVVAIFVSAWVAQRGFRIMRSPRPYGDYVAAMLAVKVAEPMFAVIAATVATLVVPIFAFFPLYALLFASRVLYALRLWTTLRTMHPIAAWRRFVIFAVLAGIEVAAANAAIFMAIVVYAVDWS